MSDKSLNDLFKVSRSEAAPEFFSEQDAERLVASHMRSVPRTTLGQQLREKLLSTPLKLGITAMTVAGIVTIGILALQPPTATQQQAGQGAVIHTAIHSAVIPQAPGTPPSPNDPPNASAVADTTQWIAGSAIAIPANPTPSFHGLEPAELSEDQLGRLGIRLADDGSIRFILASTKPGHTNHVWDNFFAVDGSIGDKRIERGDLGSRTVMTTLPRMITKPSGARLMLCYGVDANGFPNTIVSVFGLPSRVSSVWPTIPPPPPVPPAVAENGRAIQMSCDSTKVNTYTLEPGSNGPRLVVGSSSMTPDTNPPKVRTVVIHSVASLQGVATIVPPKDTIPWRDLVPIRIRNTKSAGHPNELIFWYEPTPEIAAMLPNAGVQPNMNKPQPFTLSIFPNPTSGAATVHYWIRGNKQAEFGIYNLLGQMKIDCGTSSGTGDLKLDLSKLEAGVYLLVTTTKDGERNIERIVLNK